MTISTGNLALTNGGLVSASTFGQGNAGAVNVNATGDITADGQSEAASPSPSGVTSQVNANAVGSSGGVTISTGNLSLTNGGLVSASTFGQGDAGSVKITATGDITADGQSEAGRSGITSQAIAFLKSNVTAIDLKSVLILRSTNFSSKNLAS